MPILKVKRENQQDATNSMFIIKLLSQHVSDIITPIIRRIRPCPTACGVLSGCVGGGWLWSCGAALYNTTANHSQHNQCRTPHAVGHGLVLLMVGIMMPETCCDRSLIIIIELVASCWFSLFNLCSRCTVTRS